MRNRVVVIEPGSQTFDVAHGHIGPRKDAGCRPRAHSVSGTLCPSPFPPAPDHPPLLQQGRQHRQRQFSCQIVIPAGNTLPERLRCLIRNRCTPARPPRPSGPALPPAVTIRFCSISSALSTPLQRGDGWPTAATVYFPQPLIGQRGRIARRFVQKQQAAGRQRHHHRTLLVLHGYGLPIAGGLQQSRKAHCTASTDAGRIEMCRHDLQLPPHPQAGSSGERVLHGRTGLFDREDSHGVAVTVLQNVPWPVQCIQTWPARRQPRPSSRPQEMRRSTDNILSGRELSARCHLRHRYLP